MNFKQRLVVGTFLTVIFGVLSTQLGHKFASEYFILLNVMIFEVWLYLLVFYFSQRYINHSGWSVKTDKKIGFVTLIGLLIFGINMANRIDDHAPSFWVVNGNIWLTDLFATIIALLIFNVIFAWIFKQWRNIQMLKNEKSKAELALLKSQINPHFFFNTLNNLYSLIKKEPNKAQEYVLKLSDMMRFTIYKGNEEKVTLKEEINYLNNFIELQTARYHKIINIDFQQNVKDENHLISPLLFIILLENAFKHGVEKLIDKSFINIQLNEYDNKITFKINNNFDQSEPPQAAGIGLQNLKQRLNMLYPNTHKLITTNRGGTYFSQLELKT